MRKKRFIITLISLLLLVILCLLCFTDCSYKIDYPEIYTPQYCFENYREADPNLLYLEGAHNEIYYQTEKGRKWTYYLDNGYLYHFFGIKNVPLDQYLAMYKFPIIFSYSCDVGVFKHKDITEEPIFDYTASSAVFYWNVGADSENEKDRASYGKKIFGKVVSNIAPEKAQKYISDSLKNGNYLYFIQGESPSTIRHKTDSLYLSFRITFSEYDNIVWDTTVYQRNNTYYFRCHRFSEEHVAYHTVYVPLDETIFSIPEL